jgi:hypothetical protein
MGIGTTHSGSSFIKTSVPELLVDVTCYLGGDFFRACPRSCSSRSCVVLRPRSCAILRHFVRDVTVAFCSKRTSGAAAGERLFRSDQPLFANVVCSSSALSYASCLCTRSLRVLHSFYAAWMLRSAVKRSSVSLYFSFLSS